jgi:hypothetical protein
MHLIRGVQEKCGEPFQALDSLPFGPQPGAKRNYFISTILRLQNSFILFCCQINMQRAFVVQIKAGCERGAPIQGRVEHLRSGKMTHFENAGQLIDFFIRSLAGEALEEADRVGTEREF